MPEKYIVKLTQQADEAAKKVQVIGIVYGRRDQRHRLSNLDLF